MTASPAVASSRATLPVSAGLSQPPAYVSYSGAGNDRWLPPLGLAVLALVAAVAVIGFRRERKNGSWPPWR